MGCWAQPCCLAWPRAKADHVRLSQARRQARSAAVVGQSPVPTATPGRTGRGGSGTLRCAEPSGWPQAPVAVWLGVGARPCWFQGAWRRLVSRHCPPGTRPRHGRGAPFVLRHERGGVSCTAWGRAAGSGGGPGGRQRRAPAGPSTRRGASCCRAVVQGTVVPRALHLGALRRVSRHGPRPTGRDGSRAPGGPGACVGLQPPNKGLQATANSVRSCLAPAVRRA